MLSLVGYPTFRSTVRHLTGIDLDCYKETQMERRLQTIMRRAGADDLNVYARLIAAAPARLKEFQDFLTINVSEWLRNPEKFQEMQEAILPGLLAEKRELRIWSAGCSNGSEPYSIAMILDEIAPLRRHLVIATDLDEEILKTARMGTYTEKDIKNVGPERRNKYLTRDGDLYTVTTLLRDRVTFQRQNLLSDPFPTDIDLIMCRNVVIYFTEEAKDELYRKFYQSLRPGGYLFVGGTESLLRSRELGYSSATPFFYRAVK
jgi:chemotaxis protein methyltransferase CheR